ncbi:MAG: hypothetical protein ACUBOA_00795 [Candidatus Loosdrechtia sp.]|uniref:hypothetical protein n=1 Tax=Candidatus Loosdrechtia sp. TaxID=3101272 RepID=UPI003A6B8B06|nr:MAG: hypothetical protein QY305_08655 [Candidatus Jettenia sp. AMX2]
MGTTFTEIKTMGWRALVKELGYAGATKFILLYEKGDGNYTKERKELFKDITIEDIVKEIKGEKH